MFPLRDVDAQTISRQSLTCTWVWCESFVRWFCQMTPPPDLLAVPGHGVDYAPGQIPKDIGKLVRLHSLALGSSRLNGEKNRIKVHTNRLASLVPPIWWCRSIARAAGGEGGGIVIFRYFSHYLVGKEELALALALWVLMSPDVAACPAFNDARFHPARRRLSGVPQVPRSRQQQPHGWVNHSMKRYSTAFNETLF